MTDEQIINGVDVGGCQFIAKEDEYSSYNRVYKGQCRCSNEEMCKDYPNCFYKKALKQLARKEQENEELKRELQAQRDFTAHEQKLIYCIAYDETCKTGNDYKQEKCIFKDNIKLEQVLSEIKEIAEKVYNDCDNCYRDMDTNCEVDCIDCTLGGKAKLAEQILQLISEVENA